MMKPIILLFCTFLFLTPVNAQEKRSAKKKKTGTGLAISGDVKLPLGDLSSTHWGGIGLTVGPASYPFTLINDRIGFLYEGGISYYAGKKETVSGYPYQYPGYTFIHAFGSLSFLLSEKYEIRISSGPALGLYNGKTNFNMGASLTGNYFVSGKLSIGPSIIMMKDFGTNAVWAASLKATVYFIKPVPQGNPKF